jgi:predicted DNA-binding transcriptional regulator AlpA
MFQQTMLTNAATKEINMNEDVEQGISQKVLFIPDLEKMIGRNRVTLRRWWLTGKFPRPVKLNGTTLAWHCDEINNWIEQTVMNGEREAS